MFRQKTVHFFYILLFFVLSTSVQAQGWQKHFPLDFPSQSIQLTGAVVAATTDGGAILGFQEFVSDTSTIRTLKLIKVDQDGKMQWNSKLQDTSIIELGIHDIKQASDGGYVVSGTRDNHIAGDFFLMKFNQNGDFQWEKTFFKYNKVFNFLHRITLAHDGGFIVNGGFEDTINVAHNTYAVKTASDGTIDWELLFGSGFSYKSEIVAHSDQTYSFLTRENSGSNSLTRTDSIGNVLWSTAINESPLSVSASDENGIMVTTWESIPNSGNSTLVKLDSTGNKVWEASLDSNEILVSWTFQVEKDLEGYSVYRDYLEIPSNIIKSWLCKVDSLGNILWRKEFEEHLGYFDKSDKGYFFIKYVDDYIRITKLDKEGNLYGNFVAGNIQMDLNQTCVFDSTNLGFANLKVEAKGNGTFYGISDSLGNYLIELDTGSFNITVLPPTTLWHSCLGSKLVQVNPKDTIRTDFPLTPLAYCPYLQVDISTPMLRRCFDNSYYVSYFNQGTIASTNTYVEIDFHPHLDVINSTIPWNTQVNNTYAFHIGNLNVNECGSFRITVKPNCDSTVLGQTLCVNAQISPDTICEQTNPAWDGSITHLDVNCTTDSLIFTIKNIGLGDMSGPQDYLVIEDNLIHKQGPFTLPSLDSINLSFPANGSTYRLYAGQSPGYFPPGYNPTIAYEGCGTNANGTFSTGFINMFPENDILSTTSIECQELIGSFDPNDKHAHPKGFGNEHYIEVGDDLEYRIRFQNTGTDTAFTVVIRDTLSSHLDVASLSLGASSHAYNLDIISGNILKFTFNNILLVDSTTNEPGSHGFVKFKISQQPNLPLGTTINNSAAIYFDFNEPVITNETYHEIGEDFLEIILANEVFSNHPQLSISVQPNPFTDYAELFLENAPMGRKQFELYDAMGTLVRKEDFSSNERHKLYKHRLVAGVYFYNIVYNNQPLANGKLVIVN